ncbi:c-type cytochrome domain-containing protein [Salinisphaera orenii]|uniref:c-type cytochrome domain-containing protein n=1 Tax=Salinisphaera orenii TaxID=856731 RepID=UPI000F4C3DC6|nr:c-type cytochrome domain-containing protein [Salinisphaera orenii]
MTPKLLAIRFFAVLLAFLSSAPRADDSVIFSKDIQPILNERCVVCHVRGAEQGNLALDRRNALANLVAQPSSQSGLARVEPGDSTESYLIHKLKGNQLEVGGSGARMPLGSGPLTKKEIAKFESWINEGAAGN